MKQYLDLLDHVLKNGVEKTDRTGVLEYFKNKINFNYQTKLIKNTIFVFAFALLFTSCNKTFLIVNKSETYDPVIKEISFKSHINSPCFIFLEGNYKIYFEIDNDFLDGLNQVITYCDSNVIINKDKELLKFQKKYHEQQKYILNALENGTEIDLKKIPHKDLEYNSELYYGQFLNPNLNTIVGICLGSGWLAIENLKTHEFLQKVEITTSENIYGKTTLIVNTLDKKRIIKYNY